MKVKTLLMLFTLMLCMSIFYVPAFASAEPEPERITVSTAWTDGDLLHIEITDTESGAVSAVELRLSDYAENAETITIQAVDENGNKSSVIQIKNPYYKQPASADSENNEQAPADTTTPSASESAVPDASKTFTPDGTGSVLDDVIEKNGKEFFTILTEAGNEFFLIVDRQKEGENVYLLNAVTENDLMALAKKGDGTTQSAIPNPDPAPPTPTQPTPEPTPEPEPEVKDSGGNSSSIIFIILAIVVIGGAGYYFKIYKPKKQAPEPEDEPDDFEDEPGLSDITDYDDYEREDDTE